MNSRIRKQLKSSENYERVIQKHLNDDFDVHEYLAQNNITGYNIEQYSKLFNSMLVTKNQKRKKFQSLKVNYQHMAEKQVDASVENLLVGTFQKDQSIFHKEYQEINASISTEFKVKETLCQEIIEVKKSIDFLKGDIGHLVDRNQSAKLLESKMSKVKIVADDQLKRVSLAYVKDKDQLNIRNDMQKIFSKKIKSANMHEDSALKSMKKTYLDSMVKKKQIHDRLSLISQINASIHQSGEKQQKIDRKKKRVLKLFRYFNQLTKLISEIRNLETSLLEDSSTEISVQIWQIDQFIDWLMKYKEKHLQKHEEQFQEEQQISNSCQTNPNLLLADECQLSQTQHLSQEFLQNFEKMIIKEYNRITESIDVKKSQCNLQTKRKEDLIEKLESHTVELQKIEMNFCKEAGLMYLVTSQMRQQYSYKLKSFGNVLKTMFVFLEYIQKKLNYSSSLHNYQLPTLNKCSSTFSQYAAYRHSLSYMNKTNEIENLNIKISSIEERGNKQKEQQIPQARQYVSDLYQIHCWLTGNDDVIDKNEEDFSVESYSCLGSDIPKWLNFIKKKIVHENSMKLYVPSSENDFLRLLKQPQGNAIIKDSNRTSLNVSSKMLQENDQNGINQLMKQNHPEMQRSILRHTIHHFQSNSASKKNHFKSRYMKAANSICRNLSNSDENQQNIFNSNKLISSSDHTTIKEAQRIQLLQDVDQHYYKMIKSTLKMEKENTKRNYLFMKNFKRTKYSSRDSILEQKRYQVSFSVLFSGKKNELIKQKTQSESKKSSRKSHFSHIQNIGKRFSKFPVPSSKFVRSQKHMKLSDSNLLKDNIVEQQKQKFLKLKPNTNFQGVLKKSRFSINSISEG